MTTTAATMTDVEMQASHAAEYLADKLGDGRDYGLVLADQRCGKRNTYIPFHRGPHRRVYYYQSHLDEFIATEAPKLRGVKPMHKVERIVGALGSTLPPSRVLAVV